MARRKGVGASDGTELGRRAKPADGRTKAPAFPQHPAARGRPPRLAHLVPGSDRNRRRERALDATRSGAAAPADSDPIRSPVHSTPDSQGDILCLPNPDWLPHLLTVVGPPDDLAAFRKAASGPGTIPWQPDYDRLQEDWLHRLLAPPPARRGISVEGARILAGQMRMAIETLETRRVEPGEQQSCALDLHALVPLPADLLRLGPQNPAVVAWLWKNWGTTWMLRHVAESSVRQAEVLVPPCCDAVSLRFWSADWTPWRALATVRTRWPELALHVRVFGIAG